MSTNSSGTPEPSNKPEFFVRLEEKYLIPENKLPKLKELLIECSSTESKVKNESYIVESIYYDTQDLNSYRKHFSQNEVRYKLRERQYISSQNDEGQYVSFLELKEKLNGVCTKNRIKISEAQRAAIRSGSPMKLDEQLYLLNKKTPAHELESFVEKINSLTTTASYSPQCKIQYTRSAIECPLFRITYDANLSCTMLNQSSSVRNFDLESMFFYQSALNMKNAFESSPQIIVEIKHKGQLPSKISAFFSENNIQEQSFSKYIYGMTANFASLKKQTKTYKLQKSEIFEIWAPREAAI